MPVLALVLLAAAMTAPSGAWPVPDPHLLSGFRPPVADWQAGHRGVDLAARPGTPVHAVAPGVVTFAGLVAGKPIISIQLAADPARRLTYEPVLPLVSVGDRVAQGRVIGTISASGGHCAGSCLHLGLRTADGYRDPLVLLPRRAAVLKPG
jgi:murein DD-endopeptidase MepM/ murein hydrolase activator NlpD